MRARSARAALLTAVLAAILVPAARAAIPFVPCKPKGFQCGRLTVPLDRAGIVPGTVTLHIKRLPASAGPSSTAVVALAGGPGQAALPFAADVARSIRPALRTRDLLVFDQRGTGASGFLRCPAFEHDPLADPFETCAHQLGPARGLFRTADSVADIEAIRARAGYAKLVLYGTSYGTKVAEDYAAAHPADVESLVLDSVVPPEGVDPLSRSTIAAVPRELAQLCTFVACFGITAHPLRDLAKLVSRARRGAVHGFVLSPRGRLLHLRVSPLDVLGILLEGDFNPTLRADLPAAVRSALRHDFRPLLRVLLRADGVTGSTGTGGGGTDHT